MPSFSPLALTQRRQSGLGSNTVFITKMILFISHSSKGLDSDFPRRVILLSLLFYFSDKCPVVIKPCLMVLCGTGVVCKHLVILLISRS